MRLVLKSQLGFLVLLFLSIFTLDVTCVKNETPTEENSSSPVSRNATIDTNSTESSNTTINNKTREEISTTTMLPTTTIDTVKANCEQVIRRYTLQKRTYMIPAACRTYENVSSSTANEVLTAMKNRNIDKVAIQLLIRHPSFALSQLSTLISLVKNNLELIHPEILTNSIGAIIDKQNNFRIPRKIDVEHISYLGDLVVHLPGKLVSQLTLPAIDLFLDTLHNVTQRDTDPVEAVRSYIFSDMIRLRALCTRVFSLKTQLTLNDIDKVYFLMFCAPAPICSTVAANDILSKHDLLLPAKEMFWTPSCAYQTVDQMSKSIIEKGNFRGLIERGAGCARELANKYLSVVNSDQLSVTVNRIKPILGCMAPHDVESFMNGMTCSDAEAALKSYDFTSPLALKIVSKRCILPSVHPFNITCTELVSYGQFVTSFPDVFIQGIPEATICQEDCQSNIFGDFRYQKLPQSIKNYVLRRCRPTGPIDTATVARFGGMVVKLPMDSVDSLSASDIATVLNDVKKTLKAEKYPRRRAIVRKMAKKLIAAGSIEDIADNKDFMKQLSLKDIQNTDVSLLYNSTSLDLPDSQNKFFMKKVLQSTPIENMDAAAVRQMGSLVKGLVSSKIAQFDPGQRMVIATELCSQSNWPMKSAYAINRKLIVDHLESSLESDPMSVFSPFDVEALGCECLVYFKPEELTAMSTEACQATCKAIGSCSNFQCLDKGHRQGLLASCMSCMNLTSTLSIEDFADLGRGFMQELSVDKISTMISNDDLVTGALMYFQGGCLSVPVREALKTKIISGIGEPTSFDRATYESLQELLMIFTDAQLDAANMTVINDLTGNILQALNPDDENGKRLKECCEMWLSDSDKEAIKMRTKALYSTLMRARRSVVSSSRRRRSADPWTCSEIQSVGEAFSGATISEILAIEDSEFLVCISHLGTLSGWSTEQLTTLYNRTTQLQGDACDISETMIVDMGSIVLGMKVGDISCLNFTTDDLIVALGIPSTWSTEQLSELASTVSVRRNTSIADLTADDLTNLRHILCGYDASELNNINAEALRDCGAQLGTLSGDLCSTEHIYALADKASETNGYGNVSNWDASILSELGIIAAGLSGDKLSSLSTSSLEGLSSSAIPFIQSSALAAMSPDQFIAFSESQANSITPTQRNALSAEQQNSIDLAPYGDEVNPNATMASTTIEPPSGTGSHDAVEVMNVVLSITMGLLCLCLFLPTY
ncbi:hypothetical protein LOTGIDRAFT_229110 [Lottia gigantea]|uniref:Uncharacterized protein n=1 Tax=Lottia gigantea TaxID=225164 RepID=V4A7E0_LOTGI|nr:hypothetical protein LOTGIDRAFT_229110 [Lottia gigantea]ESO89216.1 hypothetical protein LOTGIDRAFT_229110 [Lottia gigantea]